MAPTTHFAMEAIIESTSTPPSGANNSRHDPFNAGISIVQTLVLGVLLVLALITLFHCHDSAKRADTASITSEELSQLCDCVKELKGRLDEIGEAVERLEMMKRDGKPPGYSEGKVQVEEGKEKGEVMLIEDAGADEWDGEVLQRPRGIYGLTK